MNNRQIDKKVTMQVRIDKGMHKLVKIEAAKQGRTIRDLVEEGLVIVLAIKTDDLE